ncbi:transposase, partial [Streptomyces aureus]
MRGDTHVRFGSAARGNGTTATSSPRPEPTAQGQMDAVLYVDRTGIPWRYVPHDFAPWETVYGYFAAWQKDGVFDQLNGLLRRLVREFGEYSTHELGIQPEAYETKLDVDFALLCDQDPAA